MELQLMDEVDKAANEYTRGNRSKLIAAVLKGLLRTNRMTETVKEGLTQPPLTQSQIVKAALALIEKTDPVAASLLKKTDAFKAAAGDQTRT